MVNELASSRRIAAGELARGVVVLPDSEQHTAVELFREEASGGADPAIRAFASQTLPMLREHPRHAKALRPPEKVSAR